MSRYGLMGSPVCDTAAGKKTCLLGLVTFLDSSPELFDTVLQTLTGQQSTGKAWFRHCVS